MKLKGESKRLKFRVLCKQCNSYQYTTVELPIVTEGVLDPYGSIIITCTKCNNKADSLDEEFE